MAVQNNCSPSNIFGPPEQTLFLGCSVTNFNMEIGWNGTSSTSVDIGLVKDSCVSPDGESKIYYDVHSTSIQKSWAAADPGLESYGTTESEPPFVGAPAYFRFGSLEFAGLIQSWTKHESQQGKDIYTVRLTDPSEILAGCEVILADYAGSLIPGLNCPGTIPSGPYNIFNVYGFCERFLGSSCPSYPVPCTAVNPSAAPDGFLFGSVAQGYGGAQLNENGMPWNLIKPALSVLTSSIPVNTIWKDFSPHGRIVYRGGNLSNSNPRFGLLLPDGFSVDFADWFGPAFINGNLAEYFLDLSDMPAMPDDYRIAGTSVSILDLITQVCADANYDFYIELVLVQGAGGVVYKFIKVRTVSRQNQPVIGVIDQFIDSLDGPVEKSIGRELRNESTTKMIIGGNKRIVWQAFQDNNPTPELQSACVDLDSNVMADDIISPYWGVDSNGDAITTNVETIYGVDVATFEADTTAINAALDVVTINAATITVTEWELNAALASYDAWKTWHALNATDLKSNISPDKLFGLWRNINNFVQDAAGADGRDVINAQAKALVEEQVHRDLRKIYNWINVFASEFYGRRFMVRIPYNCVFQNVDGVVTKITEPTDGGWTEESTVLGLTHPSLFTDFFENDDGTLHAFVRFDVDSNLNHSELPEDSYAYSSTLDKLFVRVDLHPEFVYLDKSSYCSPRAVIELPAPLRDKGSSVNFKFVQGLIDAANNEGAAEGALAEGLKEGVSPEYANWGREDWAKMPEAAVVTLLNTVNTYGPWLNENSTAHRGGPPGQIEVQKDDGMVPWEWGSYLAMNTAAQGLVNAGNSNMQVGEFGNITFAGYPTIPLAAELGAINGFAGASVENSFYTAGSQLIENRQFQVEFATYTDSNNGANIQTSYYLFSFGPWTGLYGPIITNISVDVGTSGITTRYTLRTYTSKTGVFNKLITDRIRKLSLARRQQQKQIRLLNFIGGVSKAKADYAKKARRIYNNVHGDDVKAKLGSPHEALVAELKQWDKTAGSSAGDWRRTIISDKSIFDLINNFSDNYANFAIMSWDGLFRPVSLGGSGSLPRYAIKGTACTKGNSIGAMPPVNKPAGGEIYNLEIDIDYLNPLMNPGDSINDRITGDVGHDIDILGRGTLAQMSGDGKHLSLHTDVDGYDSVNRADYYADYRFLALRGPLVMQSWGYDTFGKPIPNAADTENNAAAGIFATSNLEDNFLNEFSRKSHTWPVAPIDLRYDRERGLWVSPPAHLLVSVTLTQDISPLGSAQAYLNSGPTLYDADGNEVAYNGAGDAPTITIKEKTGVGFTSGSMLLGYYNPQACEYWIIGAPPSGELGVVSINDSTDCYDPLKDPPGLIGLTQLIAADGLAINTGVVESEVSIFLNMDAINSAGTTISNRISKLKEGNNIYFKVEENGLCRILNISSSGLVSATNCDGEYVSSTRYKELVVGTGLRLNLDGTEENTNAEINLDLGFNNNSTIHPCSPGISTVSSRTIFEDIIIGKGLRISQDNSDSCTGYLFSNITIIDDDACFTGTTASSLAVADLVFGDGLKVHEANNDINCGTGVVSLAFTALDSDDNPVSERISKLKEGDGITFTEEQNGNCRILQISSTPLSVGESGCGGVLGGFTPVTQLVGGKGIEAVIDGTTAFLHNDLGFFDDDGVTQCMAGISTASAGRRTFEDITIGKGLRVSYSNSDPCQGYLFLDLTIVDDDVCFNGTTASSLKVANLVFGDGLKVHEANNDLNCGTGVVSLAFTALDADDGIVSNRISKLKAGQYVTFTEEEDGNCRILNIAADNSGLLVANQNCGGAVGSYSEIYRLIASTGIALEVNGEIASIKHNLSLTNSALSVCDKTFFSGTDYNEILIGRGLAIVEGSSCQALLGVSLSLDSSTDCYNPTNEPASASIDGLIVGDGLGFTTALGADCGTGTLHLTITALDSEDSTVNSRISKFKEGTGITFEPENNGDCWILRIDAALSGVEVANQDCGGSVGAFTEAKKIITGTGITNSFNGNTTILSHDITLINDSTSVCDGNPFNSIVYDTIYFGKGLSVVSGSSCQARVGLALDLTSVTTCFGAAVAGGSSEQTTMIADSLSFGDGLKITNNDTCGTALIHLAFEAQDSAGSSSMLSTSFSKLREGDNITFTKVTASNCDILKISAEQSGISVANQDCGGSPGAYSVVDKLLFENGIDLSVTDNIATISNGLAISNNTSITLCQGSVTQVNSYKDWDTLRFAKGLYAFTEDAGDSCTVNVSVGLDVDSSTDCYDPTLEPASAAVDGFIFGEGLSFTTPLQANCGTATVHLTMTALDEDDNPISTRISKLKEGNNITLTEVTASNCRILEINQSDSGIVVSNDNTTTCGGTTTFSNNIDNIIFGKGLQIVDLGGRQARVGLAMSISDVTTCYLAGDDQTSMTADSLSLGDGLKLTGPDSCDTATIHLAFEAQNSAGTPITGSPYFSKFRAGDNVTLEQVVSSNCRILRISAEQSGLEVRNDDCDGTTGTYANIDKMIFGRGIKRETPSGNVVTINHDIKLTNNTTSYCGSSAISPGFLTWDSLTFGKGIKAVTNGTCGVAVGLSMPLTSSTTCFDGTESSGDADTIDFGDGLKLDVTSCAATVYLAMDAQNSLGGSVSSRISKIRAGNNITLSDVGSTCGILKIDANQSGISVANQDCGGSVGSYSTVDKIIFGKGIKRETPSGNTVTINHDISLTNDSTSTCAGSSIGSNYLDWDSLSFGAGLNAVTNGTCGVRVGLSMGLSNDSITICGGSNLSGGYDNLIFGKGIGAVNVSSCTARVGLALNVTSDTTCFGQGTDRGATGIDTDAIRLGDGLKVTGPGTCGTATFHLAFTALNNSGGTVGSNFSRIKAGDNISLVNESSTCDVLRIDAEASGLMIANRDCGGSIGSYSDIDKLVVGAGIDLSINSNVAEISNGVTFGSFKRPTLSAGCGVTFSSVNSCTAKIDSKVTVNGTAVNTLTFVSPITVGTSSVGCGSATIQLNGLTQNVDVLCGVACVSGNIVGQFKTLTYTRGLLTSVSSCA